MTRHHRLTCRLVLDLAELSWGSDPDTATAMLRERRGFLDVTVDPGSGKRS